MGPPMPSSLGEQHGEHGLNHADTCHACVRVCDRALRSAITRSILSEDKACSVHSLIARTAPHSIIELMALSAIISNRTNPSTGSETWRLNRWRFKASSSRNNPTSTHVHQRFRRFSSDLVVRIPFTPRDLPQSYSAPNRKRFWWWKQNENDQKPTLQAKANAVDCSCNW